MYYLVAVTKCLAWYAKFLSRVFLVLERHELYPDGAVEAWTMALVGLMYSSTPQCTSKPQPLRHVGKQFTSYGSCSFDHHWSAPTSDPRRTLKPWTAHYVVHAMCTSSPPQLKKRPKHLCILSNIYVVLRFWECAFLLCVWISQKPLPEYIFSIWSTSLLVSHFLWTSSDPTSLEMSRSIQQKRSWKQCAKVVLLNPHTTPPTNAMTPGWWLCR